MDKISVDIYLDEVEKRLRRHYMQVKAGSELESEPLDVIWGFMQAGEFLGLVSGRELNELTEAVHIDVFGMTSEERKKNNSPGLVREKIDYSEFDKPTLLRRRGPR